MNKKRADEILNNLSCGQHVGIIDSYLTCLDGDFSIEEVEAILVLMKIERAKA